MRTPSKLYQLTMVLMTFFELSCAQSTQPMLVGGCDGCEGIFEYRGRTLSAVDTLPDFESAESKIRISGTIYESDGVTPADGVILYVYQTNEAGIYPSNGDEKDWSKIHGHIRGWIKTGKDGRYTFYTQKPGTYASLSAHIHPTILEPNGRYYWIDNYLFEGDPLLRPEQLNPKAPVGGVGGVVKLERMGDLWIAERDIVLGKNVAGYEL